MTRNARLKRSISLPLLILYGTGTMVGGGFYALVGKVAGVAGMQAPFCMLTAGILALFSALSFAELSARYPVSAGEPFYFERAFHVGWLSVLLGWMVISTGIVSAATLSNAIVQFLQDQFDLHREVGIVCAVASLGLIAAWGIAESLAVAVVITVIEVGGLVYVFAVASGSVADIPDRYQEMLPAFSSESLSAIGLGAFLVFYGYLGFEDMVNMAEEVKRPRRTLPIAILVSLAVTTVLYVGVSLVATLTLEAGQLAQSLNPLADVVEASGAPGRGILSIISVLAGVNGALVQVIMASRVAYGMSDKGMGPSWMARINPLTRTPLLATGVMMMLVLALALWFPLVTLAQATSTIILVVFATVNLSLLRIKIREGAAESAGEGPRYPVWIPATGFAACLAFLLFRWIPV